MFERIFATVTISLAVILTAVLPPATLAGCTPPVVPTNAIQAAQEAAQTAVVVVADAEVVWPIVYAAIPAASQAAAQAAYNEGLFAANHAILALNDAIAAAVAANTPNPDFTAVIEQLSAAVGQIVSIVQSFMTPGVAQHTRTAGGVDAVGDMSAAAGHLKALAVKR